MNHDSKTSDPVAIRAVAVGKIKEKLENIGLAMLSLALMYSNPMDTWRKLLWAVVLYEYWAGLCINNMCM